MQDRILVGTRKGLFRIERDNKGHWQITQNWFLGDPVSAVCSESGGQRIHAAMDLGHFGVKMRRSEDGGGTWNDTATPSYPEKPEGEIDRDEMRNIDIPWDTKLIWVLEQGADKELWCGTLPGGLFRSTDAGDSWQLNRPLWNDPLRKKWMGGGFDFAGIHSIMVEPGKPTQVTIAVSCGGIWQTQNSGASWSLIGKGIRNDYMPPELQYDPVSQDPHRVVQCPSDPSRMWMQHHNGIFRSDDGGHNWTEITDIPPSTFGFAVAVHPTDPNTAWFIPAQKDEQRIPVDAKLIVNRTNDGGKTFTALTKGLPSEPAYDLVYRHAMAISPNGEQLAFGSTTGGLWISENQGNDWQCVSVHLPPIACIAFEKR